MKNQQFRIIRRAPNVDVLVYMDQVDALEKLCIELKKYVGGMNTKYRRLFRKNLKLCQKNGKME